MSFYGSVSNAGKTSLTFDKVYPNRKLMEESCQNDGVFVGRCVLIEYDDNTFAYIKGYTPVRPAAGSNMLYALYADVTKEYPFMLKAQTTEDEGYVLQKGSLVRAELIDDRGNVASTSTFFFTCEEEDPDTGIALFRCVDESKEYLTDYDLNYNIDKKYAEDFAEDYAKDNPDKRINVEKYKEQIFKTGWDSTIWQKVVENGVIKYKMIASLNSDLPIFDVQGLAPHIEPQAPFFSPTSTNTHYTLLTPTTWGFKVKNADDDKELLSDEQVVYYLDGKNSNKNDDDEEDERIRAKNDDEDEEEENTDSKKEDLEGVPYNGAIFYNKAGFDKLKRNISNVKNKISMTPTGYSTSEPQYYDETGEDEGLVSKPDMQELVIQLPAIGNAVAELWDLMYGEKDSDGKYYSSRNDNIEWNDTSGLRMIEEDLDAGGFKYSENKSESVAGAINSLHDLMGMIIVPPTENQTKEEALDMAVANKIYFGAFGDNPTKKGFYYKDTEYKFVPFKDIPALNDEYVAAGKPQPFPDFNAENFVGSRTYYELNQFEPNTYYTYVDKNFYLDINNVPTQDTTYYELGEPLKVSLKEWSGEAAPDLPAQDPGKEEDGPAVIEPPKNVVYYIDNKDYINDTSEFTDETKDYYNLVLTQETFPIGSASQIPTYIWNPQPQDEDTAARENIHNILNLENFKEKDADLKSKIEKGFFTVYKNGLFYEEIEPDLSGKPVASNLFLVSPDDPNTKDFDPNKSYYKIPQYVAIPQEGNVAGTLIDVYYFINVDGTLVSFESVAQQLEGVNYTYTNRRVAFKEFEENKFYFAFEFNIGEGETARTEKGYKLLAVKEMIDDETPYYSIVATPTTGDGYVNEVPPDVEEDEDAGESEPTPPEEPVEDVAKTHYYKPGLYYIKNSTNDYILSNSLTMHPDQTYYILTDKNNEELVRDEKTGLFLIDPVEGKFYEPNKYYYFSKEFGANLMDTDVDMKQPDHFDVHPDYLGEDSEGVKRLVYFIPQEAYVVEDTAGFLSQGMIWDKSSNPPSTVTLGGRYEEPKWTELKGFSRTYNTVNGLILQLNKYFKFEDKYTRDKTTIQGSLNRLNDTLNLIDNVNPGNIMVIDDYGRISGGMIIPDGELDSYLAGLGEANDEAANEKRQEIQNKLENAEGWITPIVDTKAKNTSLLLAHTLPEVPDNELKDIGGLKVDKNGHVRSAGSITVESLNSTVTELNTKVTTLNGDASVTGSVANTATSIAAAEVAKIVANANASYDTLKEIADWILNDTTGAANMANNIAGLKELVGDTAVATQISTAIEAALKTNGVDKYALASELINTNARVKALEDTVTAEKVAQWNSAEANVQSDWNATDATSDAFILNKPDLSIYENIQTDWNAASDSKAAILNKPDLSDYITNSQTFNYEYNETQTAMTIQQLLTYIAGLEKRIKDLEDANTVTPTE